MTPTPEARERDFDGCKECGGSGVVPEHHGPGLTEMLACDDCEGTGLAPQPSVPSGEAVAIVASEIGDAIAAHDAGENVNAVDRAKHVVAALLPEMNDYWHNGYAEGKRDASLLAAPPQERVSEELREAAKFAIQVLDEQATISRTMEHLNGSITEHARAVGLEAMHKPPHGVSLALRRLTAALSAGRADV